MNGNGPLSFEATINDINFNAVLTRMENQIRGISTTAVRETAKIDSVFQNLGKLAVGTFAFNGLADLPQQILKVRQEFQGLEIAFGVLLKSKIKGETLLSEVVKEAAQTPLSLRDVANGAKQLLAYGTSAQSVVKDLHMLGDVAAGVGAPLGDIVYLYGTLRAQGRAYATDIRQFASRGIGIYEELAKVLKINVSEVNQFVESGKVGFKEVEQAFKNMTSTGGIFSGMLDAQAKSLTGLKEKLGSAWDEMLNDIGKKNEGLAASVFTTATEVVQHYQDVVNVLGILVGTYGGYRAALVLASVTQELVTMAQIRNKAVTEAQAIAQAEAASANVALSLSQRNAAIAMAQASQAQAAGATIAARAQVLLNSVMQVNPIVLVGTAIAALATAYFVLKEDAHELTTAQSLLSKSAEDTNSKFATQRAEVVSLVSILKNQNVAESERLKAYQKLNEISPKILEGLDFQKAKTADLTTALNEYLESLKKKIRLESGQDAFKDAFKQELDAAEKTKKVQEELNALKKKAAEQENKTRQGGPDGSGNATGIALTLEIQKKRQELAQAILDEQEAKKTTAKVEQSIGEGLAQGSKESLEAAIATDEQRLASLDKLTLAYKITEDRLKEHKAQLEKLNKTPLAVKSFADKLAEAETAGQLRLVKVSAKTEDQLQALQKKVKEKLGGAVIGSQEKTQLDKLDADISYALGKRTKAQKDAEKVGPYGSISYWENVVKLAEEALSKTSKTDASGIEKQKQIIINAQKQLEEVRKLTAIRSFEEEIEEKKRQYELYQKWVQAYSKQAADAQFGELLKSSQSYLEYLNNQIALLESKRDTGKLTQADAANLSNLTDQKNEITGKKTAIELFNEDLEKSRISAGNLAQYLVELKQKQDDLKSTKPIFKEDYDKQKIVADEIVKTETELQNRLNQFLVSYASSGEQQLAIQQDFAEKRAALDKRYNGNKGADYKQALKVIDDAEKQAFEDYRQRRFEETEEYKNTTKTILGDAEKRSKEEIRLQKLAVDKAKELDGVNSEVYKKAKQKLDELQKQSTGKGIQKFVSSYGAAVSQFASALSELGGTAGQVGGLISGLTSNLDGLSTAFSKSATDAQKTQAAIGAAVQILNIITTAAAQRKRAEAEYYASIIAQQQQYNLLLNEQYGIQAKNAANGIFGRDYLKELEADFNQFDDAQQKYQESLKKLSEGKAKSGQGNAVDWNAVGKSAVNGATIGTAIAPGIGTAIGAGIGAIIGFFGGKKKEDEFTNLLTAYPKLIQKSKDGVDELNVSLAQTLIDNNLVDDATKETLKSTIEWQKQVEATHEAIKAVVKDLVGSFGDKLGDSLVDAFRNGTDAAMGFKTTLEGIIEDFTTKLLYSKVLGPYLEQFGKDIEASLMPGGDQQIDDDAAKFFTNAGTIINLTTDYLKQIQDGAKSKGFDIFKPTGTTASQANALSGSFKSLTEETGSVLAGQMNAMRISQADTNRLINQQLLVLSSIDRNTGGTNSNTAKTNELLDKMNTKISGLTDGLRAKGIL
ncbi:hypothetical protein GCM10028808_60660 [Spirosoma migulaei]